MPKIGLRIVKSALAVFICLAIGLLRPQGMPFYSAIAAILCMQNSLEGSVRVALTRIIGTLAGGAAGAVMLAILNTLLLNVHQLIRLAVISAGVIGVIYTTVLLKKTEASYITCVVYLSITVSHGVDAIPYLFALNRIIDTLIGIGVSVAVNLFPYRREKLGEIWAALKTRFSARRR